MSVASPNIMAQMEINSGLARKILSGFIRDQVEKVEMRGVIVGLSGGIDSALSTYLAVDALGAENVLALRMPYKTSSSATMTDAEAIIRDLGLPNMTVDISDMADALIKQFPDMSNIRKGNIMARARMIVIYDQSAARGLLPLGTSNKTEFMLGYTTLFGDNAAAMQPIADLYKCQVRQLSTAVGVPQAVIDKPPSADLWEGQTDEGELGFTYDDVDQVLFLLVDERYTLEEVIEEGFEESFVRSVWQRVWNNHYKRTLPNVAKVSKRTLGHDFLYPRDYTGS
jgi:NAD+ synthase